ncbi:MAG: dihydrodipicolinate synthase family protein [Gemmatimonadaceae bacterium]
MLRARLLGGLVIPAHPLALGPDRKLDERAQRGLTRYYLAAGAGGVAVGVHTTQFAIRDPRHGLYEPVLALASETASSGLGTRDSALLRESASATRSVKPPPSAESRVPSPVIKIAGLVGRTEQALSEARIALDLGYHAGLLSLGVWRDAPEGELLAHCREVAAAIPLFGFYLQPAVGGRALGYAFWREFAEIPNVVAIKIAPFDRYATLDVMRAVSESGRRDVALYTGNDDAIVADLITPFPAAAGEEPRWIAGGLLGHWAVWTRAAVGIAERARRERVSNVVSAELLGDGAAVTEMNAALFDVRHGFAGCIAGIHEVLRRQGLIRGTWCLDPSEALSPGQSEELDRVIARYPHLTDDEFVAAGRDEWMR